MKHLLLSLSLFLLCLTAGAEDFTYEYEGQTLTYTIIDESARTCRLKEGPYLWGRHWYGNNVSGDLIIPSEAGDFRHKYKVIEIPNYAFYCCGGLTSVTIPNSVTSIGGWAFSGCSGLTSVTIPSSITSIGTNAFDGCTGLTKVNISDLAAWCNIRFGDYNANLLSYAHHLYLNGEEVTNLVIPDGITSIGSWAFYGCSGLTSVAIPNSVTSIGVAAFEGCSGLTSVTIPNSVTSIGSSAFSGCSGLTEVTIPDGVTSIGYSAFSGCSGLTEVTIPNSVTSIDFETFSGCSGLTSVTIPNSVTSIGNSAFSGCSSLLSVTIPNSVTFIGWSAFKDCSGLTSVTILNGVTSIYESTFEGCIGLTSVTIPNSVASIGRKAFLGCINLTDIYILNPTPPSVSNDSFDEQNYKKATLYVLEEAYDTYDNMTVGPWKYFMKLQGVKIPTFYFDYDDNNMTATITEVNKNKISSELVIPETTTYNDKTYTVVAIGKEAFKDCSSMTSVTIPSSITSIGNKAFDGCTGLNKVNISDLTAWCNIRFSNYKVNPLWYAHHLYLNGEEVTNLVIPDGITSIKGSAFSGCSGLTSVAIPNNVTSIGYCAFYRCSGLTSVTIPNSVTYIGEWGFSGCSGLTSVAIPNSVSTIGKAVFQNCSGLTSVTIPNNVTSISVYAFQNCNGLTEIYSLNVTPPSVSADNDPFGNAIYQNATLYVPEEALEAYKNAECWNNFQNIKGFETPTLYFDYDDNNMTATVTGANKDKLSSELVIPETTTHNGNTYSIVAIGDDAFAGCSSLTSVTIPNSVTSIGDNVFYECSGLTSVTIPNSVTSIGDYAFFRCSGLTSVTIPNSVTYIGDDAFNGCSSLTSVTIPDGVTSINEYAFAGCSSLTSVTIPNSVTSIGNSAFNGCSGLTSVTIPNGVTTIGDLAFAVCSGLTSVTIPNGVTSISGSTFLGCSGMTSVTIPNSVTSIGIGAFEDCSGLTSVTIPNSVTEIKSWAFGDCSSLTSVTIPNSVTFIGYCAFYDSSLTEVYSLNLTPPSCDYGDPFKGDSGEDDIHQNATLYVPEEALDAYMNAEYWKKFRNINGLESSAFDFDYDNSNMTATVKGVNKDKITSELVIPETTTHNGKTYSVVAIGWTAFKDCSGLTSVTIPNSVTSIDSWAFSGCSGLTSVTFPDGVTTIGYSAFKGCSDLTEVTIPNSVTYIESEAFYDCEVLTKINILDIASWCNIEFGANPFTMPHHFYINGEEVKHLVIPDGVTSIARWAFKGCVGLTEVTIPNSVTSIGDNAFSDCRGLTKVYSFNVTPPSASYDKSADEMYRNATLYVPNEAVKAYMDAEFWKEFQNIKGFDPTGIQGIEVDESRGQDVYYDLNGRRLSAPRKGLNIINGKKVIIK